jgi:hypothetical protein
MEQPAKTVIGFAGLIEIFDLRIEHEQRRIAEAKEQSECKLGSDEEHED